MIGCIPQLIECAPLSRAAAAAAPGRRRPRDPCGGSQRASGECAGATFTLWLPAAGVTAAGEAETAADRGERAGLPGAGWRVHGLAEIGRALREETDAVLEAYERRLRADPAVPLAKARARAQLEDHAITLLADLAQSLVLPGARPFTRPAVPSTSEITASAAVALALLMRALPHVTHAGERTRGIPSDMLPKPLRGGFTVTPAHRAVRDSEGRLFVGTGVPPEEALPLFPEGRERTGYAEAIRGVAAHLAQSPRRPEPRP